MTSGGVPSFGVPSFGVTAIVPLKTGARAKLRLSHVLDGARRDALSRTLAMHVTGVLADCGLRTVLLLSEDRGASIADTRLEVWVQEAPDLNGAVSAAIERTGLPALVVPADLPWLVRADVERLLDEPGDVVVAPTADGGTGGLLLRREIGPAFGRHSALAHARAARRAGLRARVVNVPGFSRDLDDEASLIQARLRI